MNFIKIVESSQRSTVLQCCRISVLTYYQSPSQVSAEQPGIIQDTATVVATSEVSAECVLKGSHCLLFAAAYGGCFDLSSSFKGGTDGNKFPAAGKTEQICASSVSTGRQRSLSFQLTRNQQRLRDILMIYYTVDSVPMKTRRVSLSGNLRLV